MSTEDEEIEDTPAPVKTRKRSEDQLLDTGAAHAVADVQRRADRREPPRTHRSSGDTTIRRTVEATKQAWKWLTAIAGSVGSVLIAGFLWHNGEMDDLREHQAVELQGVRAEVAAARQEEQAECEQNGAFVKDQLEGCESRLDRCRGNERDRRRESERDIEPIDGDDE